MPAQYQPKRSQVHGVLRLTGLEAEVTETLLSVPLALLCLPPAPAASLPCA
jgi:hypothetical protein